MGAPLPPKYLVANAEASKRIAMVVTIQGLPFKLSNTPIFSKVEYGDPGIFYGEPGLVYGALRARADIHDYLSLDGSTLTLSQKLEPEQGKAGVSTMTLAFIDYNNIITQICTPGFYIPDILGANVTVELGYQQLSYPTDYFVIFRGFITSFSQKAGLYIFQLSDPNAKRRQTLFLPGTTETSLAVSTSATDIPVVNTGQFYQQILGPNGGYDGAITTYVLIDNEFISYPPTGIGTGAAASAPSFTGTGNGTLDTVSVHNGVTTTEVITAVYNGSTFDVAGSISGSLGAATPGVHFTSSVIDFTIHTGSTAFVVSDTFTIDTLASTALFKSVTRGTRNTVPAAHSLASTVTAYLQFSDHAIDMALKLMLSGWDGPWIQNQPLQSIENTLDGTLGTIANAIVLPNGVDAVNGYGLVAGDQVTITGSGVPGNNITANIVGFLSANEFQPNQIILLSSNLAAPEYPTSAVVAFRSQFDTYPLNAGLRLSPQDVDVQGHLDLKQQFLADSSYSYRFLMFDSQTGKDFLETEIYLPISCYSVTRRGQVSVKLTKPPIAASQLIFLTQDNVLEPQNLTLTRALNARKFFNEINFQYDVEDDNSTYDSVFDEIDSDSLNIIGISSVLPIASLGAKSDFSANFTVNLAQRARFLLTRYKRGAIQILCKTNWATGCQIEAGDVVAVDGTGLSLPGFVNGDRNFGVQLFEVTNRQLDIRTGQCQLELTSGIPGAAGDRFGIISPSSVVASGSSSSQIIIQDSFSAANPIFPGNEPKKWENYIGFQLFVHNEDYSVSGTCNLLGFDPSNQYKLNVSGLSFSPPAGYIVDIPSYPTDGNPVTNSAYKAIHFFLSPEVLVATGVNNFSFTVGSGDIGKFLVGALVRVHNYHYTIDSGECTIDSITGTTIHVSKSLGFTPSPGQFIDLIGFLDKGAPYRWI